MKQIAPESLYGNLQVPGKGKVLGVGQLAASF